MSLLAKAAQKIYWFIRNINWRNTLHRMLEEHKALVHETCLLHPFIFMCTTFSFHRTLSLLCSYSHFYAHFYTFVTELNFACTSAQSQPRNITAFKFH